MRRNAEEIKPISHSTTVESTPAGAYRSITSQTELRKWWAPRVIMSRHIVSMEDGKDVEMRLLQSEKNLMVRYNWRPLDWDESVRETVITFEIEDLGVSRNHTGQGISILITHDGWSDNDQRNKQDKIWKEALACLKEMLEGREVKPWWETARARSGYRKIKLSVLKHFAERIDKENRGKPEKKAASQNILKMSQTLDAQGDWYIKESGTEIELRFQGTKIIGFLKNGSVVLAWRELEKLLGKNLNEYADRLALELDMDMHVGKSQEKIPAQSLEPMLLTQWCIDIIQSAREAEQND